MTMNAFTSLRSRARVQSPSAAQVAAAVVPMSDTSRRCSAANKDYWSFANAEPIGTNGRATCPVCGRSIAISYGVMGANVPRIPVHHKIKPESSEF